MVPTNVQQFNSSYYKSRKMTRYLRRSLVYAGMVLHLMWLVSLHNQTLGLDTAMLRSDMRLAYTNANHDSKDQARVIVDEGLKAKHQHQNEPKFSIQRVTWPTGWLRRQLLKASLHVAYHPKNASPVARDTRKTGPSRALGWTSFLGRAWRAEADKFAYSIDDGPECVMLRRTDVKYTLVTQCDDDRLPMLGQHCQRWGGPISVAVLSDRSPLDIKEELKAMNCTLPKLTVSTLPSSKYSVDEYPVNELRNMAIRQVQTSHVVYLDIDFLPSSNLESTLQLPNIRSALAKDYKHALVIPAFEFIPRCYNCSAEEELMSKMPNSKGDLRHLHHNGEATMFHEYWPVAHDSTDYEEWKWQDRGSLYRIPCIKKNNYEPYLVFRKCEQLPPFQEAFTGYGYNKASFTMQLQAMDYTFSQVGGVFCTHFPHAPSKARQVFDLTKNPKAAGKRQDIKNLVDNFTEWLNLSYRQTSPATPYCDQYVPNANDTDIVYNWRSIPFESSSTKLGTCSDLRPEQVTFSLVTQCTDDRLWMMEQHCKRWAVNNSKPYISLVVYTNGTLHTIKEKLLNLNCPVDDGMTVQIFPKVDDGKDYPINHLRNEALAAVVTTHAVFLDIDFWESTNLYHTLNEPSVRETLAASALNSVVIPAFQLRSHCETKLTECADHHMSIMPSIKDDRMLTSLETGDITVFNIQENYDGHGSTRYDKWVEQPGHELFELSCVSSNRYEPYLVVRVCRDLPPFQTVFTGYGKNKITWIMHLRRLGWKLFQLGEAFVTHFPHPESQAKQVWKVVPDKKRRYKMQEESIRDAIRVRNEQLFVAFKRWMQEKVPDQTRVSKCLDDTFGQDDDAWW